MGLRHDGMGQRQLSQYLPVSFPWDSDTMGLGQRQPSQYLPVPLYARPMEMGHNGTGTQWDWDTTGLGHTRTGTQQDWDAPGPGHNGIGSHRVLTPCVTLTLQQRSGTGTQRANPDLTAPPYMYPLRARNVGMLSAQHTQRGMGNSDSIPITSFYWGFREKSTVKCFGCAQNNTIPRGRRSRILSYARLNKYVNQSVFKHK